MVLSLFVNVNLFDCFVDFFFLIEILFLREKNMVYFLFGYCCNLFVCMVFYLYWKLIKCELNVVFLFFYIRYVGVREKKVIYNSFMFVVVVRGIIFLNVCDICCILVFYENDIFLLLM